MNKICVGDVFGFDLERRDNITPKNGYDTRYKFCVVVGQPDYGYYVAYLIVNHAINIKFNNTRELIDSFFPITHADYPDMILEIYDPSWVDMTEIREMETSRMLGGGKWLGRLNQHDMDLILDCLAKSRLIPTKIKRRLGLL